MLYRPLDSWLGNHWAAAANSAFILLWPLPLCALTLITLVSIAVELVSRMKQRLLKKRS